MSIPENALINVSTRCDCPQAGTVEVLPTIIQGGLGAAVSNWRLARAVSMQGGLGVVSGVALDQVLARRLQDGDLGGEIRSALEHFPFAEMARRVLHNYYISGGRAADAPYKLSPVPELEPSREFLEMCIVGNYVEIYLARQGHSNPVGINFMEKLQSPHLASIYGAMLAGVNYILMGAGIPMKIPAVLDHYARNEAATYPLYVKGTSSGNEALMHFDPRDFAEGPLPVLSRPKFLAIISSNTLAVTLLKKASGRVDGFIIESPIAGGHNAPPRGSQQPVHGEAPVYGERDLVDLEKMRALGRPFWLAGGYGSPDALRAALKAGATGVQVGTAFAFCNESGMRDDYRKAIIQKVLHREAVVVTDAFASPTGFPFKVATLEGSISQEDVFRARRRVCDLGFLREAYMDSNGKIGFRCPAESVSVFVKKGGTREEAEYRKCLCNALLAAIGMGQTRGKDYIEPGVVTAGDDLVGIDRFLAPGAESYSAADVISLLMRGAGK